MSDFALKPFIYDGPLDPPGGEIIGPDDTSIRVSAALHPFKIENIIFDIPAGNTLQEILEEVQPIRALRQHAHIFINDWYVNKEYWGCVRPKPGTCVFIRIVPSGGGGGGGKKNPLRVVLQIAVIAASFYAPMLLGPELAGSSVFFAGTQFAISAGALFSAGVGLVGMMLVNAIAPPPKPSISQLSGTARDARESPTLFITGTRNQFNPFGVVPRILGKHRMVPPYAAMPYTELLGDDQYLRAFFCYGYGPITCDTRKIGETLLTAYSDVETEFRRGYPSSLITNLGNWDASVGTYPATTTFATKYTCSVAGTVDSVAYVVGDTIIFNGLAASTSNAAWDQNGDQPFSLFPQDIFEKAFSLTINQIDGWAIRTTQLGVDEISVDIGFLRGLTSFNAQGNRQNQSVTYEVSYSIANANNWILVGSFTETARQTSSVRKGHRWSVANGQYDVRIRRTTADTNSTRIFDILSWTILRSITNSDPVLMDGIAGEVIRIRATDQLRGVIDQYNAVIQSILLDWDAATSTWKYQPTSSPASCYREVLQGPANAKAAADSRIDLTQLQNWHAFCLAGGFEYNQVRDFNASVSDALDSCVSVGRASKTMVDGKWSVIIDQVQSTPVQHFSPRNSWNFHGRRIFTELPNGWRVKFFNRDKQWKPDERIVYDDGYDSTNANVFEVLELAGITDPNHIWKDGRFHIAVARLRPDEYVFTTDFEYIIAKRGQRVKLTHDVIMVGLASSRIKSMVVDGSGNVTTITIDEIVDMQLGLDYGVSIRTTSNIALTAAVNNVPGEATTLGLSTPIVAANAPAVGDLIAFGELGQEALDCLVKTITPGTDQTATLTLIDYSPAVFTSDTGTIPTFTSVITVPVEYTFPAATSVESSEDYLMQLPGGAWVPRIVIGMTFSAQRPDKINFIEAGFRPKGSSGPWTYVTTQGTASEIDLTPVNELETYEYHLRYRMPQGAGPWGPLLDHTVIGTSGLPDAPISIYREGNDVKWTYGTLPRDFKGSRAKYRAGTTINYPEGTQLHAASTISANQIDISSLPSGIYTIMVVGVDQSGNESSSPESIIISVGSITTNNIVDTIDFKATNFPGTITSGAVIGGNLVANDNGTLYLPDGTALYLPVGADLYLPITYKIMTYEFTILPSVDSIPATMSLNVALEGSSWTLEYQTLGDSLYLPTASDLYLPIGTDPYLESLTSWRVFGAQLPVSRQPYYFKIVMAGGNTQGKITTLQAIIDVVDVTETLTSVSLASGGSRLPITKTYRSIKYIEDIAIASTSNAKTVFVVDKSITGPLMKGEDASGADTTTILDSVRIRGY